MLQPSFIPPRDIRVLREYTRLRAELVRERTRLWSRMEKLLERALIKVTVVASSIDTVSVRAMIEALIAGERDPRRLADLARTRMRARMKDLIAALDGRFEDHHAEEARIILGHIDALNRDIARLENLATAQIEAIPASWGVNADGTTGPDAGQAPGSPALPAIARLDEIAGIGPTAAMAVIAEIGLDMTVFGTAWRLVSWAKLCPQTRQSGAKSTARSPGKGDPWLKGPLGEAAAAAARSDTWLGERYRRLARRRGKRKALVATARAILVIIFHLLSDPAARYRDLGPGYYDDKISAERKIRNHVRQLEALGLTVTITPAEDTAPAA